MTTRTGSVVPVTRARGHHAPGADEELRIRPRTFRPVDAAVLVGSALSALALTWVVYYRLTPMSGGLGFLICWYVVLVVMYRQVVRQTEGPLVAADRVMGVIVGGGMFVLVAPLVHILVYITMKGLPTLRPRFFVQTQEFVGPLSGASEGGAAHAIVGTFEQVGLAVVICVPLAIMTAVYLNEVRGRMARPVRLVVDAMSGVPSIVAGLFIYAVWILGLGKTFGRLPIVEGGFSGFAASLALSVLMLPTITRTTEAVLRLVSSGIRESALALGAPEWRTTMQVVLPTARAGAITAVILGVARAVGETAPLILTAGGAFTMNWNPFGGPQDSLPYFVYRLVTFAQQSQKDRAWTGAFVLVVIVLVLFVLARRIGGRAVGQARRRRFSRAAR